MGAVVAVAGVTAAFLTWQATQTLSRIEKRRWHADLPRASRDLSVIACAPRSWDSTSMGDNVSDPPKNRTRSRSSSASVSATYRSTASVIRRFIVRSRRAAILQCSRYAGVAPRGRRMAGCVLVR